MGASFEDLEVWKKSCKLAVILYDLLRDCRDYGLKDQMLRAIEVNFENASSAAQLIKKPLTVN